MINLLELTNLDQVLSILNALLTFLTKQATLMSRSTRLSMVELLELTNLDQVLSILSALLTFFY
jgi:hypothetical protein